MHSERGFVVKKKKEKKGQQHAKNKTPVWPFKSDSHRSMCSYRSEEEIERANFAFIFFVLCLFVGTILSMLSAVERRAGFSMRLISVGTAAKRLQPRSSSREFVTQD